MTLKNSFNADDLQLVTAIRKCNTDLALGIIRANKVDLNIKDNIGYTALILASYGYSDRHNDIVSALIKAGANLDEKDDMGYTALMSATMYSEHADIARILIDAGADVRKKDDRGYTALDYARANGFKTIEQMIIEKLSEPKTRRRVKVRKKTIKL